LKPEARWALEIASTIQVLLCVPDIQVFMILAGLLVRLHPHGHTTIRIFLNMVVEPDFF
jgi:hypothetical protein